MISFSYLVEDLRSALKMYLCQSMKNGSEMFYHNERVLKERDHSKEIKGRL